MIGYTIQRGEPYVLRRTGMSARSIARAAVAIGLVMTIGSTVLSALVADAGMDVRSLAVSLFLFAGALTSTGALLWAHQDAKGSLLVSQPGEVSIATTKDGETVACVDGRTFAASAIERLELHHVRSGIGIVFWPWVSSLGRRSSSSCSFVGSCRSRS